MNTKVVLCVVLVVVCAVCLEGKPRGKGKGKGHDKHDHKHSEEEPHEGPGLIFEDGEVALITCPNGTLINITEARYGKKKKDCDPLAFEIVSELCNGNETCSFMVDDMLFEDTCFGSGSDSHNLKLKIQFKCEDPCAGLCCANGGECVVDEATGTASCNCSGSWTGPNCDENPCRSITCENNGTCLVNPQDGSAGCFCPTGFQGETCAECAPTFMVIGDGIDNDCNGSVDEDSCSDVLLADNDGDGILREDCYDPCDKPDTCAAGQVCQSFPDGTSQCNPGPITK